MIEKVLALWATDSKKNLKKKGDCLVWTGRGFGDNGYGLLKGGDVSVLAHRAAFMAESGDEIPKGYIIAQSCDNKRCCLPAHLAEEYLGRV